VWAYASTSGCEDFQIGCREGNPGRAGVEALFGLAGLIGGVATSVLAMVHARRAERPRALPAAVAIFTLGVAGWLAMRITAA
jgi:hypothetical protein